MNNFNQGMTTGGKPVTIPKSPAFKQSTAFMVPEDILVYAFRYALGRQSYAVSDVASELRAHSLSISNKMKALMVKEIRKAESENALGMEMDRQEWMRVVDVFTGGKGEIEE